MPGMHPLEDLEVHDDDDEYVISDNPNEGRFLIFREDQTCVHRPPRPIPQEVDGVVYTIGVGSVWECPCGHRRILNWADGNRESWRIETWFDRMKRKLKRRFDV